MKHLEDANHSAGPSDSEIEFEFSRRLVSRQVPYADVQLAQARTWKRLSQSMKHGRGSGVKAPRRWQPSALVAVCTLTFVVGVWVGKQDSMPANDGPRVSPEPLKVARGGQPRSVAQPDVEHAQGVGTPAGGADVAGAGSGETAHASEEIKLTAGANRERPQAQLPSGGIRTPTSFDSSNTLVEQPIASSVAASALPASNATKGGALPSWHVLANKGEYEAALVEIAQAGGYERVLANANAEQLMLLSDVARATGQQQRALAALGRIVNEHSNDPVAPLAALNMGNLLDKMGDGSGATQAFARYRALSPKGEFAEDALVRQLRSAVKAGQQELAQRLVRQYETDFPDGRSTGEVAQLAQQLPDTIVHSDAGVSQD
jgi:TolA-binding protein